MSLRVVKCASAIVRATHIERIECQLVLVRNTLFVFFNGLVQIAQVDKTSHFKFSEAHLSFLTIYTENNEPRKLRILCSARYELDDWEQHIYDVCAGGYRDLLQYNAVLIPSNMNEIYLYDLYGRYICLTKYQVEIMLSYFGISIVQEPTIGNILDLTNMKQPLKIPPREERLTVTEETLYVVEQPSCEKDCNEIQLEESPQNIKFCPSYETMPAEINC
jgi:hypothetical protein